MHLSAQGLALLRQFEGFSPTVYHDTAGLPTIGYGHKLRLGESFAGELTEEQAEQLLEADVATAEDAVNRLVTVALTQGQFDALVDFTYNLGEARLAGSTLLRDLNAGKYAPAAGQLLLWDHVGHVEVGGLLRRREAEFQMFTKGAVA